MQMLQPRLRSAAARRHVRTAASVQLLPMYGSAHLLYIHSKEGPVLHETVANMPFQAPRSAR